MSQIKEQGHESTASFTNPTDNAKGSDSLEEVVVYINVTSPLASNQEITQYQAASNIPINKSESFETQTNVPHVRDEIETTNAMGPTMASQPLLGPEVELKEEIPGDAPDPNELIKVEAGLIMPRDEFERIAEERRKGNLWDKEGVPVEALEKELQGRVPTNADVIKLIYESEFDDDLTTSVLQALQATQPTKPTCTAAILSVSDDTSTSRGRPYDEVICGSQNVTSQIRRTPNGHGKKASTSTNPLNQSTSSMKDACFGIRANTDAIREGIQTTGIPSIDQRSIRKFHQAEYSTCSDLQLQWSDSPSKGSPKANMTQRHPETISESS